MDLVFATRGKYLGCGQGWNSHDKQCGYGRSVHTKNDEIKSFHILRNVCLVSILSKVFHTRKEKCLPASTGCGQYMCQTHWCKFCKATKLQNGNLKFKIVDLSGCKVPTRMAQFLVQSLHYCHISMGSCILGGIGVHDAFVNVLLQGKKVCF